jgi:hypothetical protein
LQKVFANETLHGVEINSIDLLNVGNNFIQSAGFWVQSVIKDKL